MIQNDDVFWPMNVVEILSRLNKTKPRDNFVHALSRWQWLHKRYTRVGEMSMIVFIYFVYFNDLERIGATCFITFN